MAVPITCYDCFRAVYCSSQCVDQHQIVHKIDCRGLYGMRNMPHEFTYAYLPWLQENYQRIPAIAQLEAEFFTFGFYPVVYIDWRDLIDLVEDPTLIVQKHQVLFTQRDKIKIEQKSYEELVKLKLLQIPDLPVFAQDYAWGFGYITTDSNGQKRFMSITLSSEQRKMPDPYPTEITIKPEQKYLNLFKNQFFSRTLIVSMVIDAMEQLGANVDKMDPKIDQAFRTYITTAGKGNVEMRIGPGKIIFDTN